MNLVSLIANACNDLEQAAHDGYLTNQSMAAFIFCKALLQKLPDAHVVYDGRTCPDSEARPNLCIWEDGVTPLVHFIGILRYESNEFAGDRDQIQSLEDYAAMPAIPLLTRDLVSHQYRETQMETSPNPELGLFIVGNREVKFQYWSAHGEQYGE